MTDNNQETRLPDGGQAANPTPSTANPQAISGVDAKALAELLKPYISDEVARRTQSEKDKRIGKLEKEVTDFKSQLARFNELKADLGSEKAALRFMELEDRQYAPNREVLEESAPPKVAAVAGRPAETSKLAQALIENLGLDANDAEVTAGLRLDTFEAQAQEMLLIAQRRKRAAEAANNPAQQMPSGGGVTLSSNNRDTIAAELNVELAKNPRNYKRIEELNNKLRAIK